MHGSDTRSDVLDTELLMQPLTTLVEIENYWVDYRTTALSYIRVIKIQSAMWLETGSYSPGHWRCWKASVVINMLHDTGEGYSIWLPQPHHSSNPEASRPHDTLQLYWVLIFPWKHLLTSSTVVWLTEWCRPSVVKEYRCTAGTHFRFI